MDPNQKPDQDQKFNIIEFFETIGMHAFFRNQAEKQVAQLQQKNDELQKVNEELQGLIKDQVEKKMDEK